MDTDSRRRYATSLRTAGMMLTARMRGFAVQGASLEGESNNLALELTGGTKERWLAGILAGDEPAGLRGHLVSCDAVSAEKLAEDISLVILAGREAQVLGDPLGFLSDPLAADRTAEGITTCFRCLSPIVLELRMKLSTEFPNTAARLLSQNWADVILVALRLHENGRISFDEMQGKSAFTGLEFGIGKG